MASVHDHHRERTRELFFKNGLDGFQPHQALEFLLFQVIPRGDTNELAHRLINRFGGYAEVFEASCEQLEEVEGVGPKTALFLYTLGQHVRFYLNDQQKEVKRFQKMDEIVAYLRPKFVGCTNERVYMLGMGNRGNILFSDYMAYGGPNTAPIDAGEILRSALTSNSVSVVLAHNHPKGLSLPSAEDVSATEQLRTLLQNVHIDLAEHLIFSATDYTALKANGYCHNFGRRF